MVSQGPKPNGHHIFVDIEVDLTDPENFLFAYIHDRDATGIFVRTTEPEAPGTRLNVRLTSGDQTARGHAVDCATATRVLPRQSPRQSPRQLTVDGLVTWINPYRPGDNNNLCPGMAVRFLDLSKEQRGQLIALIKCITFLDDDARSTGSVESAESVGAAR